MNSIVSRALLFLLFPPVSLLPNPVSAQSQQREDEIVANLAGGRVIVQVAKDDVILFAAIDQPLEAHSVPPRVLQLDAGHIGIILGAIEWQVPSNPQSIRLDRNFQSVTGADQHYQSFPDEAAPDLETIGFAFLETLRPLVAELHHKIEVKPDDPIFEVIVLGFAKNYGPEVWKLEYRIEQQQVATRGEYWQTRIQRPRFTQLYPPEGGKHAPRTLVEVRYPAETSAKNQNNEPPLIALIQGGDPAISRLRSSDQKFIKVVDAIDKGQAHKAVAADSADFLRAALPLIAGDHKFILGAMEEQRGFNWIVPPDEPVEKTDEKTRPPSAPSLRKKPTP